MKRPFDIKYRPQIESGEYKVVIYMGNNPTEECLVEILKWDSNSDAGCIVGCFQVKGKDKIYVFDKNGEHKVSGIEGNRLYIITPEPELTEFEKAVKNMMSPYVKMPDEIHKEKAAKLLELARIQFLEEQYTSDPRKTDLYKLGKAEALEELKKNLADNDIYNVPEWLREVLVMAKEPSLPSDVDKATRKAEDERIRQEMLDFFKNKRKNSFLPVPIIKLPEWILWLINHKE